MTKACFSSCRTLNPLLANSCPPRHRTVNTGLINAGTNKLVSGKTFGSVVAALARTERNAPNKDSKLGRVSEEN